MSFPTKRVHLKRTFTNVTEAFIFLGLMIAAFAKAGCILKDDVYLKRAIKAASFVKKYLWSEETGKLIRSCYKGDDGDIVQL